MLTDEIEHTFEPPAATPGAVQCGGNHYAKARREPDSTITWVCTQCGMERVMADGQGWR